LLPELDRKNRSGGIVDRRFGESDSTLTPEERMLERFTKERQRGVKGVDFNLDDDNELTHYGQSLSAFDDFDGSGLALEDNIEEGKLNFHTTFIGSLGSCLVLIRISIHSRIGRF
jgi:nucleolar protein 14